MATNSENIDLMMRRLGSRSSPTVRTQVVIELNKTIRELERGPTKPWFMETRLEGELTAEQDYIALPASFLQEVEEGAFRILIPDYGKWLALEKKDYDQIRYRSENWDPQCPTAYALYGKRIYFSPTPDLAYAYRWEVLARTEAVVDNTAETTNDWLLEFYDLVSLITIDKVARFHIRATDIARDIAQPLDQARDHFWRECEARQQINRDYEQE